MLVSPQVFGMTASYNMLQTRSFLDQTQTVGPLPASTPPAIRSFAPFGTSNIYNLEYTWSSIAAGYTSSSSPFSVSVVEGIPVGITVNYTSGSTISGSTTYALPTMSESCTFLQALQYLAATYVGGSASTLDISSPVILSNTYPLSKFATANGSSATGPYQLSLTVAQNTPLTVNIAVVVGITGSSGGSTIVLSATLFIFPDWTIAAVQAQYNIFQGLTSPSNATNFYALNDQLLSSPYANSVVLSTIQSAGVVNLIAQNYILYQNNNVYTFFGITGPLLGVSIPLGGQAWQLVDYVQQYPSTTLSISPLDPINMGLFTMGLSVLPTYPPTFPVKALGRVNLNSVIPNDATSYVIQDDTNPNLIGLVSIYQIVPGSTSGPSPVSTAVRLLSDSVLSMNPSPLTQNISTSNTGMPVILDPGLLLSSVVDENSQVSLYLTNDPTVPVNFLLPTGQFVVLHSMELSATISYMLAQVQINVSTNFNVLLDTTVWYGSTQLSNTSTAVLGSFPQYSFVLKWVTVNMVSLAAPCGTEVVPVPNISSPTTTLQTLAGIAIPIFHFRDPWSQDYFISVNGVNQNLNAPLYPFTTGPSVTFGIKPSIFAGKTDHLLSGLVGVVTALATVLFGIHTGVLI